MAAGVKLSYAALGLIRVCRRAGILGGIIFRDPNDWRAAAFDGHGDARLHDIGADPFLGGEAKERAFDGVFIEQCLHLSDWSARCGLVSRSRAGGIRSIILQLNIGDETMAGAVELKDMAAGGFEGNDHEVVAAHDGGQGQLARKTHVAQGVFETADGGPQPVPNSSFFVQIGAFGQLDNAERMLTELRQAFREKTFFLHERPDPEHGKLYKIRCGPYVQREHAEAIAQKLVLSGFFRNHEGLGTFVVGETIQRPANLKNKK